MPIMLGHTFARRLCAFVAAGGLLILLAAGELGRVGGAEAVTWWANGGWTCCGAIALGGCLAAARRSGRGRRAWLFFAGGCASWLAGQIVWDYNQLVDHLALPFPSLGDAGYLGFVPLFALGIFALPRPGARRGTTVFFGLDVAIAAVALALIGGVATQGLLLSSNALEATSKVVALAYPVAYLTLGRRPCS